MNRTEFAPCAAWAPRPPAAPCAARLFQLRGLRDVLPQVAALLAGALLAATLLACSPLAAQDVGRPADVVRAFHDALATGDSALVLTLLAEDVVIFESGGVEASREEYRSHHLPADIAFARSTEKEVTVDRVGFSGDVAWVSSHSTTTGSFRGQDVNRVGTETMILRKTQMGWRIEHIHWSSRDVPREGS